MKKLLLAIFLLFTHAFTTLQLFAEENISTENFLTENNTEDLYPTVSIPEYKPAFFKMLLILIALIALIFLTFYIFKRLMKVRIHQANMTKNIKVLEKRIISPKSILYLIEIEGKRILISESNLELRKIKDLN